MSDADNINDDRATPLHAAALCCDAECVELLLAGGGDARALDVRGAAPIDLVPQNGRDAAAVRLLLEKAGGRGGAAGAGAGGKSVGRDSSAEAPTIGPAAFNALTEVSATAFSHLLDARLCSKI